MNTLIKFCLEIIRIQSPLGDFVEFQSCSNYPDCSDECKKVHKKKEVES